MKTFLARHLIILAFILAVPAVVAGSATIVQADELRFDFSSRKAAESSYARVFGQFSPAGSRAFDREIKKLVIVQFSPDGTVSGGRAAIKRKKPTPAQFYAAMARALDGKTAAEVVSAAERVKD